MKSSLFAWAVVLLASYALPVLPTAAADPTLQSSGSDHGPALQKMRALLVWQSKFAKGDTTAVEEQARALRELSTSLLAIPQVVWASPHHGRLLLLYTLSGGDVATLRRVVSHGQLADLDPKLVSGILAYRDQEEGKAATLLLPLQDPTGNSMLDGALAIARATLRVSAEPKRALEHLSEAQLYAPGTLIEEAALRRQGLLLIEHGSTDEALRSMRRYLRRYPTSIFAAEYVEQFSRTLARNIAAKPNDQLDLMFNKYHEREDKTSLALWFALARSALELGHLAIARNVAQIAEKLVTPGSQQSSRVALYRAAADQNGPDRRVLATLSRAGMDVVDHRIHEVASRAALLLEATAPGRRPSQVVSPAATDVIARSTVDTSGGSRAGLEIATLHKRASAVLEASEQLIQKGSP
jgi:chemotaxis protein MotC